jgi:hypothetical protein
MSAHHDDYFLADIVYLLRRDGAWRFGELLLDTATQGGFLSALEEALARAVRNDQRPLDDDPDDAA